MNKNYDSILVFDRPITLKDENGSDWTAYGYVYDSTTCPADENEYVRYLVGLEQWFSMGNISNPDKTWTDSRNGITYDYDKDGYVGEFCWEAFAENPVSFFCKKGITFCLPEDCIDDSFIISENFWRVALNMILDLNIAEQKAMREQIESNGNDEADLPF